MRFLFGPVLFVLAFRASASVVDFSPVPQAPNLAMRCANAASPADRYHLFTDGSTSKAYHYVTCSKDAAGRVTSECRRGAPAYLEQDAKFLAIRKAAHLAGEFDQIWAVKDGTASAIPLQKWDDGSFDLSLSRVKGVYQNADKTLSLDLQSRDEETLKLRTKAGAVYNCEVAE